MKLKYRLMLSLGLLMLLSLLIGGAGILGVRALDRNIIDILDVNNPEMLYASELQASIQDRSLAIRNVILLTDPQMVAQEVERMQRQEAIYRDSYAKLGKMFDEEAATSIEEKQMYAKLREYEAAALPVFREVQEAALKNERELATSLAINKLRPLQRVWSDGAQALKDKEIQLNQEAGISAKRAAMAAVC